MKLEIKIKSMVPNFQHRKFLSNLVFKILDGFYYKKITDNFIKNGKISILVIYISLKLYSESIYYKDDV